MLFSQELAELPAEFRWAIQRFRTSFRSSKMKQDPALHFPTFSRPETPMPMLINSSDYRHRARQFLPPDCLSISNAARRTRWL